MSVSKAVYCILINAHNFSPLYNVSRPICYFYVDCILGKPVRALDTLYDVIKSKKRHHNFSEKLIEQIMFKYLELCVDLKKSHIAKEGLFQYRNMCQLTNVASLASVVQGTQNYSTTIIKIVQIK